SISLVKPIHETRSWTDSSHFRRWLGFPISEGPVWAVRTIFSIGTSHERTTTMRTRRRFAAHVESLEGKALLSVLPTLSQRTINQVLKQIDRAAGIFAKTHNENAFVASLSQISTKLPFGHSQLFPTWQADTAIYDPTVPGSGMAMVKQLKADLKAY